MGLGVLLGVLFGRVKDGDVNLPRVALIKLKDGRRLQQSNWDSWKVNCISVCDTEHMTCGLPREKPDSPRRLFRLKPESKSVVLTLTMLGGQVKVGGINATQYGVNSNIATTGHKLQGMSKDNVVVVSWNYETTNWVYVVLSRVRTMKGLFLCRKLDESKDFSMDPRLQQEERRLKQVESLTLSQRTPLQDLTHD